MYVDDETYVHFCKARSFLVCLQREKFHAVLAALDFCILLRLGRVTEKVLLAARKAEFSVSVC
jgi:hypothetical protein